MSILSGLFLKAKNFFHSKYWTDPVWSKVISASILFIIGSILTATWALLKSAYSNISFESITEQVITYFKSTTQINNLVIWILYIISIWAIALFINDIIKKVIAKNKIKNIFEKEVKEFPVINETSTEFFSARLSKAFPGQRGLIWYDAKTSVERLKILFKDPLLFKPSDVYGHTTDPIWYFRGSRNLFIKRFRPISRSKVLLGTDELEIKRMAVYISQEYYRSFIYIEAKGEKQTGLYKFVSEDKKKYIEMFGYHSEEYALLGGNPISREQFDDGAAVINDKIIDASNAELRTRYLSDYNIIISAKKSPYNSKIFDRESKKYLDEILQGKQNTDQFFRFLDTLERNDF